MTSTAKSLEDRPKYRPCYSCAHFGGFTEPQADEAGLPVKMARCLRVSIQVDHPAQEGCNSWLHLAGTPKSQLPPW